MDTWNAADFESEMSVCMEVNLYKHNGSKIHVTLEYKLYNLS